MPPPPIVYAGPSVSRREALEALPGADLRPPIRRWDLYRDREQGGTVFVLLDGVFFQEQAVAPREILDVLADGALVVGAASMGALRAAECWPAGMAGVGTIYRLFRRGLLTSDDEVAVVFASDGEHSLQSVPLVNVRYAVWRAVRQGWMERDLARRLIRTAEETFYPERSWPALLDSAGAGPAPEGLAARLAACDLKNLDALRALRRVARWLAADPGSALRPRRGEGPFVPRDGSRERAPAALAGADVGEMQRGLARWQLLSGRGGRRLLAVAAAHPELELAARLAGRSRLGGLVEELRQEPGTAGAAALQMALLDLWADLALAATEATGDGGFAAALWGELALTGDLDAEIFRWRAVREGAERARQLGLAARGRDRYAAEMEIASAHGFSSWRELGRAVRQTSCPWASIVGYRDELALARRLREALFNPGAQGTKPKKVATVW